ncbi:MAG: hypothetical protein Ct9H90mP30_0780 [Actinomycetota bacterium]|nr:MAG: hypothetical protein Ct9H90mP30_0780 [Actinomycetota bacterium]
MTPLLKNSIKDPIFGPAVEQLPIPVGDFGSPELIAKWIAMMLSPAADFMCGSLVYVDGGFRCFNSSKRLATILYHLMRILSLSSCCKTILGHLASLKG